MPRLIDNLIAYRMLSMLVTPFVETDAYKLGIIDDKGNNLIKTRNFTKIEQREAYTYLHRLVFNLKKILIKLPGGDSKLKNLIAAFFLIKESYQNYTIHADESQLKHLIDLQEQGVILVEETLTVSEFVTLFEDAPANATGAAVSTNTPVIRRAPKKFARFVVNDDVYKRFANGKSKFRKWSEYLNLEDEGQKQIYNFARKNPNGVIILQNGKESRAIRFNRVGGGSWSKVKRTSRQINTASV